MVETAPLPLATRTLPGRDEAPVVAADDVARLVASNTAFSLDLYAVLSDAEGNLFYSPYSISLALALAYAGARGETERQMADTLRFDLPQEQLHPSFNALEVSLAPSVPAEEDESFRLNVANSVWGQEGHAFLPAFLDTLTVNYGQRVRPVDFLGNPDEARIQINDWVAGKTEDRIRHLIPSGTIDELTRLVLANAVYFKAAWHFPFDQAATANRPFHPPSGNERDVPMMRQQSNLRYSLGDGYQAVELPYVGGEVAMTILLPDRGRFQGFEESLNGAFVEGLLEGLDYQLVRLTMPKFEFESAFSMSATLDSMGMTNAFDERAADFSGMDGRVCPSEGDLCLWISDVLHRALVSVDEAGTEAAAATAVIVGITRAEPAGPHPIKVVVDRPFLFIIRHLDTGTALFIGRVLEP